MYVPGYKFNVRSVQDTRGERKQTLHEYEYSVRKTKDPRESWVRELPNGMEVTVVENKNGAVRVKTSDGVEGWLG